MLCPYHWTNKLKSFSSGSSHKEWKYYQVIIHNTYQGGNVETGHHVICPMPEEATKHFTFPNYTTPVPGTLRCLLYNNTTTRDKISFNGLWMTKVESGVVSMLMKTGMEVSQYYTVFNYIPPRPLK